MTRKEATALLLYCFHACVNVYTHYSYNTQTGMKQHQELGQILRRRYILGTYRDFLSENYTRVQVSSLC